MQSGLTSPSPRSERTALLSYEDIERGGYTEPGKSTTTTDTKPTGDRVDAERSAC